VLDLWFNQRVLLQYARHIHSTHHIKEHLLCYSFTGTVYMMKYELNI